MGTQTDKNITFTGPRMAPRRTELSRKRRAKTIERTTRFTMPRESPKDNKEATAKKRNHSEHRAASAAHEKGTCMAGNVAREERAGARNVAQVEVNVWKH